MTQETPSADSPDRYESEGRHSIRPVETSAVGHNISRIDTLSQVTGRLTYIEDLSFPGMLHARVLRSRHPHARIVRIDTREAEAMPGVMATVTGKELPDNGFGITYKDQPVLAEDKVRHMGDGVAAVAAISEEIAAAALEKIKVDYDPLPAMYDPLEAMKETAPRIHDPRSNIYFQHRIEKGDIQKAFAESHLVVEERFTTPMVEHMYIETHTCIADWDAKHRLTVWSTLGRITLGRTDIARILGSLSLWTSTTTCWTVSIGWWRA